MKDKEQYKHLEVKGTVEDGKISWKDKELEEQISQPMCVNMPNDAEDGHYWAWVSDPNSIPKHYRYCKFCNRIDASDAIAQERRKAKIEVLEWVLLATRPENTEPIFDLLDELKEDKVRVTAADGEFNIASGELTLKEDKE